MVAHPNGNFHANFSILDRKNYDNWCKQMKVVFGYQDVWDFVQNGVTPIGDRATDEERVLYKDKNKKD
jgi:hypothetical protein